MNIIRCAAHAVLHSEGVAAVVHTPSTTWICLLKSTVPSGAVTAQVGHLANSITFASNA